MQVIRITTPDGRSSTRLIIDIEDAEAQPFRQWEVGLSAAAAELLAEATKQRLLALDTQGQELFSEGEKFTSKGQVKRVVETLGGPVEIMRHVYQTSAGGSTRAPMDERAGLIGSSTPQFASTMAAKVAEMTAGAAARDMATHHGRPLSPSFAQDIALAVSGLSEDRTPFIDLGPVVEVGKVALILVGMDGAMINICRQGGWRQALAGTLSLYDKEGERLDTEYIGVGPGVTPPEGKGVFFEQMERALKRLRDMYPKAEVLGVSDAASDFLAWMQKHTEGHLVDYHHAAEYLTKAAPGLLNNPVCQASQGDAAVLAGALREQLRDEPTGAGDIHALMAEQLESHGQRLSAEHRKGLQEAVTYFGNHHEQMTYAQWREQNRPIGSGVTEAACKVIIKARLTQSGMRWSVPSAHAILSLRALFRSPARWVAFWTHHDALSQRTAL
jgi:hypothetical protein